MDPIVRQFPIKTICFENVLLLFPITSKTEHSDSALWVSCQHPSALAASFLRRKVTRLKTGARVVVQSGPRSESAPRNARRFVKLQEKRIDETSQRTGS